MELIAHILFNKVKKQFSAKGIEIKDFIFVDFKTGLFSIDNSEPKKITSDLTEFKDILSDVESLYLSPKKVTIIKTNGDKIEQ